jgi:hypothetical protein
MWSIVWHLALLPGAQIVTDVNRMLTVLAGPASTMTGCVFWTGCVDPPPPPPPPPQPPSVSRTAHSPTTSASRHAS